MMEMHSKIVLHCSLLNVYTILQNTHSSQNGMNVPIIYMGFFVRYEHIRLVASKNFDIHIGYSYGLTCELGIHCNCMHVYQKQKPLTSIKLPFYLRVDLSLKFISSHLGILSIRLNFFFFINQPMCWGHNHWTTNIRVQIQKWFSFCETCKDQSFWTFS